MFASSVALGAPSAVFAEDLETILPYVVDNHDRVKADEARLSAARNRATEAIGDWLPQVSQTANFGHESQNNESSADTAVGFSEYDLSLTQLLWDFGSTNAAVDKARLQVEEARFNLQDTRLSLITEAITAFMDVIRDNAGVKFARQSEDNIREQTGLEEALVGLGSGFSTDVLQAKSQLARAQARRVQNEGALKTSLNRYKAVFGRMPDNIPALEPVSYPAPFLPQSLNHALDIAYESNPALKNAILASDIAREDVRVARADSFFPRIEATGERKFKRNVGGTLGSEQETLAKIEMTFDFNLGFTAINTLRASNDDLTASTYSAADTRRTIEEDVRNAWQELESASLTAAHLNNQATIEEKFLELARNERQLGNRTLKEVLDSETTLINAQSDALSAETDVIIAAYSLLAATGQLNYDVLKRSKGIKAPIARPENVPSADLPTKKNDDQSSLRPNDDPQDEGRSTSDLMAMFAKAENAIEDVQEAGSEQDGDDIAVVQDIADAAQMQALSAQINPYNVNNMQDTRETEIAQKAPSDNAPLLQEDALSPVADTASSTGPEAINPEPALMYGDIETAALDFSAETVTTNATPPAITTDDASDYISSTPHELDDKSTIDATLDLNEEIQPKTEKFEVTERDSNVFDGEVATISVDAVSTEAKDARQAKTLGLLDFFTDIFAPVQNKEIDVAAIELEADDLPDGTVTHPVNQEDQAYYFDAPSVAALSNPVDDAPVSHEPSVSSGTIADSNPLVQLFSFLEAAHNRLEEGDTAKTTAISSTGEPAGQLDEPDAAYTGAINDRPAETAHKYIQVTETGDFFQPFAFQDQEDRS